MRPFKARGFMDVIYKKRERESKQDTEDLLHYNEVIVITDLYT